jgi:hypothetical protein
MQTGTHEAHLTFGTMEIRLLQEENRICYPSKIRVVISFTKSAIKKNYTNNVIERQYLKRTPSIMKTGGFFVSKNGTKLVVYNAFLSR